MKILPQASSTLTGWLMSFSSDIPAIADNAICTAPHVRWSGTRLMSPYMQEYILHIAQQPGGVPNHVEKTSSAELHRIVSAHVRDLHASHCGEVTRGDDSCPQSRRVLTDGLQHRSRSQPRTSALSPFSRFPCSRRGFHRSLSASVQAARVAAYTAIDVVEKGPC